MKLPLIQEAQVGTLAQGAADLNILIIANACQTVDETLNHYRATSSDPELLDRNNEYYLGHYRAMIPTVSGQRREIVDAVNAVRQGNNVRSYINEHNSYALNGVYLYSLLCMNGYAGRVHLVDNI